MNAALTLARREVLRFLRQRSRMIGVIASPILFWIVIGSGLNNSFQYPGGPVDMSYLEYFYPGTLVLVVLFSAIFSSISIIEDRGQGFLQSVLVAPISRMSIVLGKVLGITTLAILQAGIFLLAAPVIIPGMTAGSLVLTLLVLMLVAFGLSTLGFLIAWSMDSTQGFHAIMNLLLVPMWLLSGALFPASGSSSWVAFIMQWNPLMYGVTACRRALYGLAPDVGPDFPTFGMSIFVLFIFWFLALTLAVLMVQKRQRSSNVRRAPA
ncbi:MAG: ABC transporter permease [Bacteroidota bacterium]